MRHFVVSDLHLNMGRLEDGTLHPLEDFDSHEQFDRLIDLALRERAALIINGDWLDFLQLDPLLPIVAYQSIAGIPLAYTARDALEKLETCLKQQAGHFETLRRYLSGGGRLAIVQGNHDADLFFPAWRTGETPPLQARIRKVLQPSSDDAVQFIATSLRIGSVHVEHGHQRCEPLNAFQNHPDIFHADRAAPLIGELRIELLWGSRFVGEFFNRLEREYPFADNLKPMTRALWLGIRNRWVGGREVARLLRFLWDTGVPGAAFAEVLDAEPDAVLMVQGLPDPRLKSMILERMESDSDFKHELVAEMQSLSEKLPPQRRPGDRAEIGREEVVAFGQDPTLGVFRDARELREARHLLNKEEGVTAVVFGHTHQEIDGHAADAPVPRYFNTGTWIPRIDLRDERVKARLAAEDFPLDCLKDPSLFQRRLMYADIRAEGDVTEISLQEIAS